MSDQLVLIVDDNEMNVRLARDVLRVQWYVSAIPGIAILVTVLAVSLVGQGLNDALNPRLKSR